MYKIIKDQGSNSTVWLVNTDNNQQLDIGLISPSIIKILTDIGVEIQTYDKPEGLKLRDAWSIPDIPTEAKDKLAKLTMPMKKPVRKQKSEQPKQIDAMDVLLGRAHY